MQVSSTNFAGLCRYPFDFLASGVHVWRPTMAGFQTVKGFRDFYPEDCALRNYIFSQWRKTASTYGFFEYEGAVIEQTALFKKKSGDEITSQLFCFEDKGGREVALRPEVTPSLARMAAARQRDYKKPIKWFQIGSCFRYEEPQRGRTREFVQFNADILGEAGIAADAELVAFAIDTMRRFGFTETEFSIRLSDRRLWTEFLVAEKIADEHGATFLQIIDKMERTPKDVTDTKLKAIGLSLERVESFIASVDASSAVFAPLRENLEARGLWKYVKIDPGIVRGLAYYTGTVFEVFDLKQGRGGIADIEFVVQYAVLANASRYPELLTYTDNIRQLDGLERCGVLSIADAARLRYAYRGLRRRIHLLKLQEQSAQILDDMARDERENVIRIWRRLMENAG